MDVSAWLISIVAQLLGQTKLPTFLVNFIIDQITKELTPANLALLKTDVECFICAHLKSEAGANPSPTVKAVLDGVEALLNCANCAPKAAVKA